MVTLNKPTPGVTEGPEWATKLNAALDALNAAKLEADSLDPLIPKSLVDAKGDLLVGSAADTVVRVPVGSNGQVLTADSAQSAGVKWATPSGGGGGSSVPNWTPGGWLVPGSGITGDPQNNAWGAANSTFAVPFLLTADGTLTGIGMRVATAGSSGMKVRLAVYAVSDDLVGVSQSLVVDAGEVAVDSTGFKSASVSQALAAGKYLAVAGYSGSFTAAFYPLTGGWFAGIHSNIPQVPNSIEAPAYTYGAFPSTLTFSLGTGNRLLFPASVLVQLS